jgi:hypothetical protein
MLIGRFPVAPAVRDGKSGERKVKYALVLKGGNIVDVRGLRIIRDDFFQN